MKSVSFFVCLDAGLKLKFTTLYVEGLNFKHKETESL